MAWSTAQAPNTSAINSSSTTIALAYGSNVTAGNPLYAAVISENTDTTITLTDSQGNTWTQITGATHSADPGFSPPGTAKMAMFRAVAGSSAANTVTATFGAATYRAIAIFEIAGTTSPTDGDTSAASGLSSAPDPGNVTVNNANNIVILANEGGWGTNLSPGGSFTEILDTNNFYHPWFAYLLNAGTGSLATAGGTSTGAWVALAAVVEEASGGGSILPLVACDMRNVSDTGGMRG